MTTRRPIQSRWPSIADYVVRLIKRLRRNPPASRQYWVIWGATEIITSGSADDKQLAVFQTSKVCAAPARRRPSWHWSVPMLSSPIVLSRSATANFSPYEALSEAKRARKYTDKESRISLSVIPRVYRDLGPSGGRLHRREHYTERGAGPYSMTAIWESRRIDR